MPGPANHKVNNVAVISLHYWLQKTLALCIVSSGAVSYSMVRLTGLEPVWLPPPDFKSGSSHQFGHNRIYGVIVFVWYTPCKIVTYTLIRHVRLRAISLVLLVSNSSKRLVVPLGFEPRYYRLWAWPSRPLRYGTLFPRCLIYIFPYAAMISFSSSR